MSTRITLYTYCCVWGLLWIIFSSVILISCSEESIQDAGRPSTLHSSPLRILADSLASVGQLDSCLVILNGIYESADANTTPEDKAFAAGLLGKHYLYQRGKVNVAHQYLSEQRDLLEIEPIADTMQLIHNYLDMEFLHVKKLELTLARTYALMAQELGDQFTTVDSVLNAEISIALGHVYFHMLEHQRSNQHYHEAGRLLSSTGQRQDLHYKIQVGLINNFNNDAQPDSATIYLDKFALHHSNNPDLMAEYNRLYGVCHYRTSSYHESARALEKATDLYQQLPIPDPYNTAHAFLVLSAAYQYSGNFTAALTSIDSALICRFGSIHDLNAFIEDITSVGMLASRAEILADMSFALRDTHITHRALQLYKSVDTLRRNFIKLDIDAYLHQQFYDNYYYWKLIEIYAFMFDITGSQRWLHGMHDQIAAYKAQGFARDRILNQLYHSPARDEASFRDFIENDIALEKATQHNNASQINHLLRHRQELIGRLKTDIPEILNQLMNVENLSADHLLKFTETGKTAVINYYIGNTYYNVNSIYILVATNGDFRLQVLNPSSDILSMNGLLYGLHKRAAASDRTLDTLLYYRTSHALYEKLFSNIQAFVQDVEELMIIPDQQLHLLSFEALVTNNPLQNSNANDIVTNAEYLIDEVRISYAYTPNALQGTSVSSDRTYGLDLLAMGYSSKETLREAPGDIPELNSSYREIEEMKKLSQTQKSQFFTGYDCTKANFLDNASDAAMIHISTHGTYDQEDRTSAALLFRKGKMIDKLYQYELRYQEIKPRLLVLSACDSGAGKLSNEEGMLSIGRTFQAFGAEETITALWPLSMNASAEFFGAFYRELYDGKDPETALRNTKLHMHATSGRFALPGYWAGLVLH